MLATPKHGWSDITIGDWHDRCSYIDDVPFMLLEAVDAVVRTYRPSAVEFDAEGYEYIIVFDVSETHIIFCDFESQYHYYTVEIDIKDLTMELINDIRKDVDLWSSWGIQMSEDELCERQKDLSAWCDVIEKTAKQGLDK